MLVWRCWPSGHNGPDGSQFVAEPKLQTMSAGFSIADVFVLHLVTAPTAKIMSSLGFTNGFATRV